MTNLFRLAAVSALSAFVLTGCGSHSDDHGHDHGAAADSDDGHAHDDHDGHDHDEHDGHDHDETEHEGGEG